MVQKVVASRIARSTLRGGVLAALLGAVGIALFLPRQIPAESLDRPVLIDTALRLCRQIPDDDCRDMGPEMIGRSLRDEVRARRLRASAKVELTLQLIRQQWLAGRHEEARTEAGKLISWSRKQKCPEDADGERMRQRLVDALSSSGTAVFRLDIAQSRARDNPAYDASGAGAEGTFQELVACSSIDEALTFLAPLPDSTRSQILARSLQSLPGRAPLDSVVALQYRLPFGSMHSAAYNNLALHAARVGRLDIAMTAVESMPDDSYSKANVLSFVAQELARAGRTSEAMRFVTQAFELSERQDSLARRGLDINGYEYAGTALVLTGASDELARRRPIIPDAAWRRILMARASEAVAVGHIEKALSDIKDAQVLPVWFNFGDNTIDEGVVEWIGAQADAGNDEAAVRALSCLHSRTLRSHAWSRIAQARARRGDVSGATAAADSITQSCYGLAEAMPAVSIAQAAVGNIDRSLTTLDAASTRLNAMCGLPNDGPLGICPHAPECPPVGMIFDMRRQALRGIGATVRTRAELDRLLAGREAIEQATILLGTIESDSR